MAERGGRTCIQNANLKKDLTISTLVTQFKTLEVKALTSEMAIFTVNRLTASMRGI